MNYAALVERDFGVTPVRLSPVALLNEDSYSDLLTAARKVLLNNGDAPQAIADLPDGSKVAVGSAFCALLSGTAARVAGAVFGESLTEAAPTLVSAPKNQRDKLLAGTGEAKITARIYAWAVRKFGGEDDYTVTPIKTALANQRIEITRPYGLDKSRMIVITPVGDYLKVEDDGGRKGAEREQMFTFAEALEEASKPASKPRLLKTVGPWEIVSYPRDRSMYVRAKGGTEPEFEVEVNLPSSADDEMTYDLFAWNAKSKGWEPTSLRMLPANVYAAIKPLWLELNAPSESEEPTDESTTTSLTEMEIGKKDRAVLLAFAAKRAADGNKLETDGKQLDGLWMGGKNIASWQGDRVVFNDLGSKAAQTVQNALRKVLNPIDMKESLDEASGDAGTEKIWPETMKDVLKAREDYTKALVKRADVVRANKSRLIRKQVAEPLPSLPPKPLFPFAYVGSDYVGMVLGGEDAVPEGAKIVWRHHATDKKESLGESSRPRESDYTAIDNVTDDKAAHLAAIVRDAGYSGGGIENAMEQANDVIDGFGVEAIKGDGPGGYWQDTVLLYVNLGDTYDTTLCYDTNKKRFFVGDWGGWVETFGDRYKVESMDEGSVRTPALVFQLYNASGGTVSTAAEWRVSGRGANNPGMGKANDANLKQAIELHNASLEPGGANDHLASMGDRVRAVGGIIRKNGPQGEIVVRVGKLPANIGESVDEADMTVAKEIIRQLGGNMFTMMTGAKGFLGDTNSVAFKVGRNSKGVSGVKITLDPSDTYTMRFFSRSMKEKAVVSDVYAENLRSVFTTHTGLDTSMGQIRMGRPSESLEDLPPEIQKAYRAWMKAANPSWSTVNRSSTPSDEKKRQDRIVKLKNKYELLLQAWKKGESLEERVSVSRLVAELVGDEGEVAVRGIKAVGPQKWFDKHAKMYLSNPLDYTQVAPDDYDATPHVVTHGGKAYMMFVGEDFVSIYATRPGGGPGPKESLDEMRAVIIKKSDKIRSFADLVSMNLKQKAGQGTAKITPAVHAWAKMKFLKSGRSASMTDVVTSVSDQKIEIHLAHGSVGSRTITITPAGDVLRVTDNQGGGIDVKGKTDFYTVEESLDEATTGWRTTDSGHHIYLNKGAITKGNPHLLRAAAQKIGNDDDELSHFFGGATVSKAKGGKGGKGGKKGWLANLMSVFKRGGGKDESLIGGPLADFVSAAGGDALDESVVKQKHARMMRGEVVVVSDEDMNELENLPNSKNLVSRPNPKQVGTKDIYIAWYKDKKSDESELDESIPGLAKWLTFAGGTGAAEGKMSYQFNTANGQYHIWPVSNTQGKHIGYHLKFANQPKDGGKYLGQGLWIDLGRHRAPAAAARAARQHDAEISGQATQESLNEASGADDDEIIKGMARALYTSWWADEQEQSGTKSWGSGTDIEHVAPATSKSAMAAAKKLAARFSSMNGGVSLTDLFNKAGDAGFFARRNSGSDYLRSPETTFGFLLAMRALGHGVGWDDNIPVSSKVTIQHPHTEYYESLDGADEFIAEAEGQKAAMPKPGDLAIESLGNELRIWRFTTETKLNSIARSFVFVRERVIQWDDAASKPQGGTTAMPAADFTKAKLYGGARSKGQAEGVIKKYLGHLLGGDTQVHLFYSGRGPSGQWSGLDLAKGHSHFTVFADQSRLIEAKQKAPTLVMVGDGGEEWRGSVDDFIKSNADDADMAAIARKMMSSWKPGKRVEKQVGGGAQPLYTLRLESVDEARGKSDPKGLWKPTEWIKVRLTNADGDSWEEPYEGTLAQAQKQLTGKLVSMDDPTRGKPRMATIKKVEMVGWLGWYGVNTGPSMFDKPLTTGESLAEALINVRVTANTGDTWVTQINGTLATAKDYFLGKTFNIGIAGRDKMVRVTKVEPLDKDAEPEVAEGWKRGRGIDPKEYPSIKGLEGPFMGKNGRVVYYDPKEGRYYDSKSDIYLDRDDNPFESMREGRAGYRRMGFGSVTATPHTETMGDFTTAYELEDENYDTKETTVIGYAAPAGKKWTLLTTDGESIGEFASLKDGVRQLRKKAIGEAAEAANEGAYGANDPSPFDPPEVAKAKAAARDAEMKAMKRAADAARVPAEKLAATLTADERKVLSVTVGYISSARRKQSKLSQDAYDAAVKGLKSKGLLTSQGALTPSTRDLMRALDISVRKELFGESIDEYQETEEIPAMAAQANYDDAPVAVSETGRCKQCAYARMTEDENEVYCSRFDFNAKSHGACDAWQDESIGEAIKLDTVLSMVLATEKWVLKKTEALPLSAPVSLQLTKMLFALKDALRPHFAKTGREAVALFVDAMNEVGFQGSVPPMHTLGKKWNLDYDKYASRYTMPKGDA